MVLLWAYRVTLLCNGRLSYITAEKSIVMCASNQVFPRTVFDFDVTVSCVIMFVAARCNAKKHGLGLQALKLIFYFCPTTVPSYVNSEFSFSRAAITTTATERQQIWASLSSQECATSYAKVPLSRANMGLRPTSTPTNPFAALNKRMRQKAGLTASGISPSSVYQHGDSTRELRVEECNFLGNQACIRYTQALLSVPSFLTPGSSMVIALGS